LSAAYYGCCIGKYEEIMINNKDIIQKSLKHRVIFDVLFIIGAFFLPWWLMFIAIILGVFLFGFFWEGIFYAVLIDSVFGVATVRFWYIPYFFTLVVLFGITISLIIRRKTRMYAI
jgi:hypothetical protein